MQLLIVSLLVLLALAYLVKIAVAPFHRDSGAGCQGCPQQSVRRHAGRRGELPSLSRLH